jgi:hypothetical protein
MQSLSALLVLCFAVVLTGSAVGQKQYMWCPDEVTPSPRPDALKGLVVDVVFTDARVLTSKVKDKCESTTIANAFVASLQKAFPSASIALASSPDGRGGQGRILVEVSLTAYSASFLSANWMASVGLSVRTTDFRVESVHGDAHQIAKERKAFNMGGMATAKKNLMLAYVDTTTELIDYLATRLR